MSQERRAFSREFKQQMVDLVENGKSKKEIIREYNLGSSSLDRWILQANRSGSFIEKENRTSEQQELIDYKKRVKQLEMEVDIFKASRADHGTKIEIIQQNQDRYSVSAMCKVLGISRSNFYYGTTTAVVNQQKKEDEEQALKKKISTIFRQHRSVYGASKIKVELEHLGETISKRRIRRLMQEMELVSTYARPSYKPMKTATNEAAYRNVLNRQFKVGQQLTILVSDLTYVKVGSNWHYICLLIDLYNREIVGSSAGARKDAALVQRAFATVKLDLHAVSVFHTDRGSEFKNEGIDEILEAHGIERSLSQKGNPYDNAVAETTFKTLKTEWINGRRFESLKQLSLELFDYINWYNNLRIHGSLGYLSPVAYRLSSLKKVV
ncbi:IS3 family transposase [Planococcus maritimus]|uniref:IS3 family transposase n=1 Tax=Planococcus maritimus TaxID=192421 RepID=A0A7D7MB79_PLAMR|nr:IS3 family transposase [Planococcus maritimus]QMT18077.1 IS3 family transposase [Planococcus maritimus]